MTTNQSQRQRMAAFVVDLVDESIDGSCGHLQALLEKHHLVNKDELYCLKPWIRELAKDRDVG